MKIISLYLSFSQFFNLSVVNQLLKDMVKYDGLHIPADSHKEQQWKINEKPCQKHRYCLYHQYRRRPSGTANHEHHRHSEMSGYRKPFSGIIFIICYQYLHIRPFVCSDKFSNSSQILPSRLSGPFTHISILSKFGHSPQKVPHQFLLLPEIPLFFRELTGSLFSHPPPDILHCSPGHRNGLLPAPYSQYPLR